MASYACTTRPLDPSEVQYDETPALEVNLKPQSFGWREGLVPKLAVESNCVVWSDEYGNPQELQKLGGEESYLQFYGVACKQMEEKSFVPIVPPAFRLMYKSGQLFEVVKQTKSKSKESMPVGYVGITDELFPYVAVLCGNNSHVERGAEWRNYSGRCKINLNQGRFQSIKFLK